MSRIKRKKKKGEIKVVADIETRDTRDDCEQRARAIVNEKEREGRTSLLLAAGNRQRGRGEARARARDALRRGAVEAEAEATTEATTEAAGPMNEKRAACMISRITRGGLVPSRSTYERTNERTSKRTDGRLDRQAERERGVTGYA